MLLRHTGYGYAADPDLTACYIPESCQQACDCCFARTGSTDQRDEFPLRNLKAAAPFGFGASSDPESAIANVTILSKK